MAMPFVAAPFAHDQCGACKKQSQDWGADPAIIAHITHTTVLATESACLGHVFSSQTANP